jgi:hypothetical protein
MRKVICGWLIIWVCLGLGLFVVSGAVGCLGQRMGIIWLCQEFYFCKNGCDDRSTDRFW